MQPKESLQDYMQGFAVGFKDDPGNPDICPVFDLQKIFGTKEWVERVDRECRSAEIGCVDNKKALAESLNERLRSFRTQRAEYADDPDRIRTILAEGAEKARETAAATMKEVREAMMI